MIKTPEEMWDDFMERLAVVQPLGKQDPKNPQPPVPHKMFLGSADSYKKIFLTANAEEA